MTAFVANTNNLDLTGLQNAATGLYVNNATVEVTIKDGAGEEVTGATWPITMYYVEGSSGDYRGTISHVVQLSPGRHYVAEINVTDGPNVAFWAYEFKASARRD